MAWIKRPSFQFIYPQSEFLDNNLHVTPRQGLKDFIFFSPFFFLWERGLRVGGEKNKLEDELAPLIVETNLQSVTNALNILT